MTFLFDFGGFSHLKFLSPPSRNTLGSFRLFKSPNNLRHTYADTDDAADDAEEGEKVVDAEAQWRYLGGVEGVVHQYGHYEGKGCAGEGAGEVDEEAEFGDDHGEDGGGYDDEGSHHNILRKGIVHEAARHR